MKLAGFSPIAFSGFDVRFYVRLALVLLAWRNASADFGNMEWLAGRDPLYIHTLPFVQDASLWIQRNVLNSGANIAGVQVVGMAACGLAFWRPSRLTLAAAFVSVSTIDFCAYLWRYQHWDTDLCLAVLLMLVLAPCNLKEALSRSRAPSHEATIAGGMLAVYMAMMYCVAGVSKLVLSPTWFSEVHLGNNWRTQFLDAAQYDPLSYWLGERASWFFISFAPLASLIAFVVMVDQIILPLAMVNRHFRIIGPLVIFANHAGIALSLGIFFSSMPILGPAVFLPWRSILPGRVAEEKLAGRTASELWRFIVAASVAGLLVLIPGLTHKVYHPFADNFIFGWFYPPPETYRDVYVIGYRHPDGDFRPYPRGYGGFIEARHANSLNHQAVQIMGGSTSPAVTPAIRTLACAARPRDSNRWLMGPLAMPEHRWSAFPEFDYQANHTLYILRGAANPEDVADKYRVVRVTWTPVHELGAPNCPRTSSPAAR